jgi:DNA-binding transcriptional MerR regulator
MGSERLPPDGNERSARGGIAGTGESEATWEFATIGEVARKFGFTLRALRFYEEKGLVSPRRSGNRRLYSPRDQRRLEIIAQGKRIGLALEEIRTILRASNEGGAGSRRHLEVALEKCEARVEEIRAEKQLLDEYLAETLQVLDDLKSRLKIST